VLPIAPRAAARGNASISAIAPSAVLQTTQIEGGP
jgi:hypothetical protein